MRQFPAWAFWGMTLVAVLLTVALGAVWGELQKARDKEAELMGQAARLLEERDAAAKETARLKKEQQAAIDATEKALKEAMKEAEELLREAREAERIEELRKSNNPPP
jgi:hypothetical protein